MALVAAHCKIPLWGTEACDCAGVKPDMSHPSVFVPPGTVWPPGSVPGSVTGLLGSTQWPSAPQVSPGAQAKELQSGQQVPSSPQM